MFHRKLSLAYTLEKLHMNENIFKIKLFIQLLCKLNVNLQYSKANFKVNTNLGAFKQVNLNELYSK